MTMAVSDYPRKQLGKVAAVNGITTADVPWIAAREASAIIGITTASLTRWEEEGMVSVLQSVERAPRLYLRAEMEVVAALGLGAPPNLRAVRRYVQNHAPGGKNGNGPTAKRTATESQRNDAAEPDTSEGPGFVTSLASFLRGRGLTTESFGELRLRVTDGPGSRAVDIHCMRRPSDGDRWWFSWNGGVWLCEADNPTEAGMQVKAALRRVGAR